jgi:hypothetical protein
VSYAILDLLQVLLRARLLELNKLFIILLFCLDLSGLQKLLEGIVLSPLQLHLALLQEPVKQYGLLLHEILKDLKRN